MRTLMTANHAPQQILSLYGDDRKVLIDATNHIGRTAPYRLIQGHVPYGIHRLLGLESARYFTFLRDPVSRFISDLAMGMRDPGHGFHHLLTAPGLTQENRIRRALEQPYYSNTITQYLSGSFCTQTIALPLLNTAIDNMWGSEFIGISEDFEVSLLIMAKKMRWKNIVPQKANVRPDSAAALAPDLRALIERELVYDRSLYALGVEHLEKHKRHYGSLLLDAASQLSDLVGRQQTEHPDAQYQTYQVGQSTTVPLDTYNDHIGKGTPLDRWLNT